ncbi:MAG: sugar isomerase domain-containing protein [Beutenbergiaceae bacterium]
MTATPTTTAQAQSTFADELARRLQTLRQSVAAGELDSAIDLLTACVRDGGVIQCFGTGHSEAFSMEVAGRAGGLIPTHRIALRNTVLNGQRSADELIGSELERDGSVVSELLAVTELAPQDVFIIASNSGVNSSIVGMALAAKERGHSVIAVTSLEHTMAVPLKHPSGKRLSDVADVVIDNLAPYGDATTELPGGVSIGAVSSLTAAYIAQALTIGVVTRLIDDGQTPPVFLSANIPAGDAHNQALQERYGTRIHSL